jgi:glycosyltransferase involved in cell wall biosynthesis
LHYEPKSIRCREIEALANKIGRAGLVHAAVRKFVPLQLRRKFREQTAGFNLPGARPLSSSDVSKTVTLVGYLSSASGLGEGARLAAEALADAGYSVGLIDATATMRLPSDGARLGARSQFIDGDIGGPLIVHINPPDFQLVLSRKRLSGGHRKLIAYWAWEVGVVPGHWRRAFRLVHEIWVPSRFVADALQNSGCTVPLRVVHHPIRETAPVSQRRRASSALRVLTVFAYDSGFERKNPLSAVAAFRSAFGQRNDVELVIKVRGKSASGNSECRLAAAISGMENARVMDGTISRAEFLDLLSDCDVLLSLHRAEGFGLVLAEAMLMGKPVVATAWSGNLDFMTDGTACLVPIRMIRASDEYYGGLRASWAEPSVEAAAAWLTRLIDPDLRNLIGTAAREHVKRQLGLAAFSQAIAG